MDFGFDRFTNNARRILALAQNIAHEMGTEATDTEHALLAILSERIGMAFDLLAGYGVDFERIDMATNFLGSRIADTDANKGVATDLKNALEKALIIARQYGHFYVGSEHLLYGLLSDPNSRARQLIQNIDINPASILQQIENIFQSSAVAQSPESPLPEHQEAMMGAPGSSGSRGKMSMLATYALDLTKEAKEGKLDPTIGRSKEIERVIHVLTRKTKNNPVLIGDPGVGKTAIVEGLATKITRDEVPANLKGKKIYALDLGAMIAGTKFRGEFEERIKRLIQELERDRDAILFIDELHTILGAGAAEGSMDASNMLKPALSRGKITCIGATTLDEYRKYVERDTAFERRFQPIIVEEPTLEDTIKILEGIQERYEDYHQILIESHAIILAARLAHRYIADRFLPDKAIDLLDEACSAVVIREKVGENEELKKMEQRLEETTKGKDKAIADQAFEVAASLRDQEKFLQDEIEKIKTTKRDIPQNKRARVDSEDIARVVHSWTGVPMTKLVESDKNKFAHLEKILSRRIIGQEEAIAVIAQAIRRSRAGIGNPKRPIGSFIFLGPTGVGKTELAKVLAQEVYERDDALVKIDMSEFMEKHNVSRLIGAPAGYVGYEDGGRLTEAIRKKPYSIILFDEIEKAHPEVFNILLQIFEDGQLTDAKGRKVDFRNTTLILTSNLGINELSRAASMGFKAEGDSAIKIAEENYEKMKEKVLEKMKKSFNPEFLNRIDDVVVFRPLTQKDIATIVAINLEDLASRVAREKGIILDISKKAKDWIAVRGFDPEYGARPIRRLIEHEIETRLAEGIVKGEFKEKDKIKIDIKKDAVFLEKKKTLVLKH